MQPVRYQKLLTTIANTILHAFDLQPVYTANMQAVTANGVSSHLTVEALHPTDEETIQSNGNPDRAQLIFLLAVLALALIVAVTVAILIPFVILVYIPVVACTGYLYFFKSVAKETDLHINPS